jgi:hypothetical protein
MPWWVLGWDVVCWLGQRRFARHWSVGQSRAALADTSQSRLSADAIETSMHRSQQMLAARRQAPGQWAAAYADVEAVRLAIDGLQPEQGPATLSVVRALERQRVWFAEPLRSSATTEVQQLLGQARVWAERLGKGGRLWRSAKQDAFVRGSAAECPGGPHRYWAPHFLRDVAQPVVEADSHAQVKRRRTVRGLRAIEREVLAAQHAPDAPQCPAVQAEESRCPQAQAEAGARDVGLDDCAAVRGILNDAQGGPLHPPGLRLAEALGEVQASRQRNLAAKKGGRLTTDSRGWPETSTGG